MFAVILAIESFPEPALARLDSHDREATGIGAVNASFTDQRSPR
jgi:hypothetical protein